MSAHSYRRVHRLTPLMRAWKIAVALATAVVFNFTTFIWAALTNQNVTWGEAGTVIVITLACVLVAFAVSQIWWAATGFRLGTEDVVLRRGVLSTKIRSARYDRIQAVDVVEPLAARIIGLSAVRIEAAGGAGSAIEIGFLPRAEAEQVRCELLARISADTPPEYDYLIAPIPIARSLLGAALRLSTIFTTAVAFLPVATNLSFTVVVPILIGFIPTIFSQIDQSWRYNARLDRDVLHLSYGLANRRSQAVPLDRIHAVRLSQPVLWRMLGWWTVSVNIAGYGSESNKASGTSRLLPVGTYEQALTLMEAISPLSREELAAWDTDEFWQVRSPHRASVPSPIDAHRQASTILTVDVDVNDDGTQMAFVRHGFFSRKMEFIETSHIQEITYRHGPLQRAMGLAHVRFDLVPGPVRMKVRDVDTEDAWGIVDTLRARELTPLS